MRAGRNTQRAEAIIAREMQIFLLGLSTTVDQYVAFPFGPGSVSGVGIANRISGTISSLGQLIIIRVLLPEFSKGTDRPKLTLSLAYRTCALMFFTGGVLTAGLYVFSEPLLRILFERGKFGPSDTALVAVLLILSSIQIPVFLGAIVFVQYLHSIGRTLAVAAVGLLHLFVKLLASYVLVRLLGLGGMVLSDAVVFTVVFATLGTIVFRTGSLRG